MRRLTCALAVLSMLGLLVAGPATAQALPPPPDATLAVAVATEADDGGGGACSAIPWIGDTVCGAVGDAFVGVVGWGVGNVVEGGANAILTAMVGFVAEGAGWLLGGVASTIDDATRPALTGGWFRDAYRGMSLVAVLGLLPFLLLAIIQGIVRQDAGMLLRATFGYVPLAAVGTAAAVVVVDLLVELTDQLSLWIGQSIGADLEAFATGLGSVVLSLTLQPDGAVAGFAALLAAAVVGFVAFVIWLELLLRQAAIYVAVLFLPLGFMAMVWPATAHWLRRLIHGLVAIILSKFVIVAVLSLAASALDVDVAEDGFAVVVSGAALLSLGALSPYVLLRLIPVFEAGMASQLEGTLRRPTAAVGPPARGGQVAHLMRQRLSDGRSGQGPAANRGGSPDGSGGGSGGPSGAGGLRPGTAAASSGGGGTKTTAAAGTAAGVAAAGAAAAGAVTNQARTRSSQGGAAASAATPEALEPPDGTEAGPRVLEPPRAPTREAAKDPHPPSEGGRR